MGLGLRRRRTLLLLLVSVCLSLGLGIFTWLYHSSGDHKAPSASRRRLPPLSPAADRQVDPTYPLKELSRGFSSDSHRVVHLDLKGGPPRLDYVKRLLPQLVSLGATALLLEWEDMFPYSGSLRNISAKNAYTRQEVRRLLTWAHDLGLEVIPLVQTFGHLEHALKLEEFRHLRELPDFPQEVCPSKPGSLQLIEEMIRQVVSVHQGLRFMHLGADEVFHIAACSKCAPYTPRDLYSRHVIGVAELVHSKYPGVTLLIWDDMLRGWPPGYLSTSRLASLVEPVVWAYTSDVNAIIPHHVWYWYTRTFKKIWVAGAFKGAGLPTSDLPDLQLHYQNTRSWLSRIKDSQAIIAGFVLTGWSRFDHFAVLCELLPSSVPSLLLNLAAISEDQIHKSDDELMSLWRNSMHCSRSADFNVFTLKHDQRQLSTCAFPGVDFYSAVLHLILLRAKTDTLYVTMTQSKGWMTRYNIRHNFTNPWRIVDDYTTLKTYSLLQEVEKFKNSTRAILLAYLDSHGTEEWLEQKVQPMEEKLHEIGRNVEKLINRSVWPRRPIGR